MNESRIEALLERIVDQNDEIINKLDDIVSEVRCTNEELNWVGETAFAKQVIDTLSSVETAIYSIQP